MSFNVFRDAYLAEKENKNQNRPWGFIVKIILIPILLSLFLLHKEYFLTEKSISTLINVLAIFIGFLIAALVPYFEIASNALNKIEVMEEIPWEIETRRKLFKIIFPTITLSIVFSLLGLAMLITLSLFDETALKSQSWPVTIINFVVYYLLISNFFNLFNLTRRTSSLVTPVLEERTRK